MQKDFYINRRFFVMPSANLLTDLSASKINRLDEKVMQLICILAEHQVNAVSREELLTGIWQNDASAEENLNQGIATLRKMLEHAGTDLIKTIPQKGYILNADIIYGDIKAFENLPELTTPGSSSSSLTRWIIIITMVVIALAIYFIFSS